MPPWCPIPRSLWRRLGNLYEHRRRSSFSVAGTMNVWANLAGTASSLIGGYLFERSGNSWNLFVLVLAKRFIGFLVDLFS
jgi:hypothetical protein